MLYISLRKFVSDPFIDCLATEISLWWFLTQHLVNGGCAVSVGQPLERMFVVTKPPVDGAISQFVHVFAQLAFATPPTNVVRQPVALTLVFRNKHTHLCLLFEVLAL